MSDFDKDFKKLQKIDRADYIRVYHDLGNRMFAECDIPTVADIVNVAGKKNGMTNRAKKKISQITSFTGNEADVMESIKKTDDNYSEEESNSFMRKVIASNINDITNSGFFYKKLMSSCDNMKLSKKIHDCGAEGELMDIENIDENTYNYKIKTHWIPELKEYTEDYDTFMEKVRAKDLTQVHVRNFLTCEASKDHRTFCPKCAGIYSRAKNQKFVPENIGVYATLMITEHATQASLDSMNNGRSVSVNEAIEEKLDEKGFPNYEAVKAKIEEVIDNIGNVGVMSKYYEVAMLSRFYRNSDGSYTPAPLISSFAKQKDKLGRFIYSPTEQNFKKLLSSKESPANSLKSRVMFDIYDD